MFKNLTAILFWGIFVSHGISQPIAQNGVLDLREYSFAADKTLYLEGEWQVFEDQILEPDAATDISNFPYHYMDPYSGWDDLNMDAGNIHQFGYVTYRLKILMPDSFPAQALRMPNIRTAYELYVNREKVAGLGVVGKSPAKAKPYWRSITQIADFEAGSNELVLVVSNFDHHSGGITQPIAMGGVSYMNTFRNYVVGGVLFLVGCLMVAGIFALGLFWFKPSNFSGLLFFLFCCAYTYWILASDYHLIHSITKDMDWGVAIRLEFIALCLSISLYSLYIKSLWQDQIKPLFFHIINGISVIFIVIILGSPPPVFTFLFNYYLVLMGVLYGILAVNAIRIADYGHKATWVNMIGISGLGLVVTYKIMVATGLAFERPLFEITGNVIFIFSQAVFMAIMFGRNYRESSMAALSAARTRDEFLNTMSHELKTPMNAILGMATFLEKSSLTPTQKDKLSAIKQNGESLMSLITDVLSISEVGSGNLKLRKTVLSLESCVNSAFNLSRQHLKKDKVTFSSYIDPEIPVLVKGDISRIKQILMHLLNNAFKFTPKGTVTLRVELLEEADEILNVQFDIKDTGVGMNLNKSSNMFTVFTQAQLSGVRKNGSSGIGLSVVRKLIELMGGKLTIKSKKKGGTHVTFNILLDKYHVENQRQLNSIFERNEVDRSLKILYAEDNPVNQKLISLMLNALGVKADIAQNGEEAVKMALHKYYNIILMDIQMPVMDGMEASRRIIENASLRPIIIATTANLAEVDKRKCFEAGMNDFLGKPIHQDELKLALIKWQGLKKYLDGGDNGWVKLSS